MDDEREKREEHVHEGPTEPLTQDAGETAAADAARGEEEGAEYPQQWQSTKMEELSGIPTAQREVEPESIREVPKGFVSEAETDEDEKEREKHEGH